MSWISSLWWPSISFFRYGGWDTWWSAHPRRWHRVGAWEHPRSCSWEGEFRMECWFRWCDVLPKIAFGSDRASSFLLGDFAKGTGGWGFCRYTANYLAILMSLSADDSKGVLEKAGGGFHCIGDALAAFLWNIYPVSLIMFKYWADVQGLLYMRCPGFPLLWFFMDDHFFTGRCQGRAVVIKVPF